MDSPSSEISLEIADSPVGLTRKQLKNKVMKEVRIKMRRISKTNKFIVPLVKNLINTIKIIETQLPKLCNRSNQ